MKLLIPSIPSKKQHQKSTSAKKILKGITYTSGVCLYTMLVYPVKLCIVPNTPHARREAMLENYRAGKPNQTYRIYRSRGAGCGKNMMYEDLIDKRVYRFGERSIALSVNDNESTNVNYQIHEPQHGNFNDHVDDSIFEDFIRRNRERFVLEKEETASVSMGQQRSSSRHSVMDDWIFEDFIRRNRERFVLEKEETASVSMGQQRSSSRHSVMDDWIFEDFIRRNRKRFQLEKEEIISIDDYSDDEEENSV